MKPRPPSPLLIPSLVRKQIEARSYSPLKINFRLGSVQFAKNNPRNDRARSKAISRVHHHEFSFLDQNESSRDSIIFQPAFVTTFPLPELINSPLSSTILDPGEKNCLVLVSRSTIPRCSNFPPHSRHVPRLSYVYEYKRRVQRMHYDLMENLLEMSRDKF